MTQQCMLKLKLMQDELMLSSSGLSTESNIIGHVKEETADIIELSFMSMRVSCGHLKESNLS